jgi:hypothetical protein
MKPVHQKFAQGVDKNGEVFVHLPALQEKIVVHVEPAGEGQVQYDRYLTSEEIAYLRSYPNVNLHEFRWRVVENEEGEWRWFGERVVECLVRGVNEHGEECLCLPARAEGIIVHVEPTGEEQHDRYLTPEEIATLRSQYPKANLSEINWRLVENEKGEWWFRGADKKAGDEQKQ